MFLIICLTYILALEEFYHTTEQIHDYVSQLDCPNLSVETISTKPVIQLLKFSKESGQEKFKNFIIFGEHARELISVETGMHLIKVLCGEVPSMLSDGELDQFLEKNDIQLVINANPLSRARVEKGDFCLRENEDEVDINRNYDFQWKYVDDNVSQISSGSKPFSEPETQAISEAMKRMGKIDMFLTVHSGIHGIFMPYAYEQKDPEVNFDNMFTIVKNLNENFCESKCEIGPVAKFIGYNSYGSSLDWAYSVLGVRYSFAWEIFEGGRRAFNLKNLKKEQSVNLAIKNQLKRNSFNFLQFISNVDDSTTEEQYDNCFKKFNPADQETFDYYVINWSNAILSTIIQVNIKG